jgi:DNA repair exonuclease SbcCD ATPase subunit
MKIINLIAENYKRLQVVEVTPDGALVDVNGRNAQGKSSLLDSIYAALAGASAIPSKPIRKGEKQARIELKLGDGQTVALVVKRTFTRRDDDTFTTSIVVENAEGARYGSPQKMLDSLLGALSFDPLAFTRMKPREQRDELRKLVPGIDFDAVDMANKGDYDRRTDVNRQAKSLRAQLDALKVPGDPRQERVDEAALVTELEQAGEQKAEIEKERARRQRLLHAVADQVTEAEDYRTDAKAHRARIEQLRKEIAEIEITAKDCDATAAKLDVAAKAAQREIEALPALAQPVDTSALITRIQDARRNNTAIDDRERAIERREQFAADIKKLEAQSTAFTDAIATREHDKAKAVAAANLPVDDLTFGEDEVLLNGFPFDQASDAERLCASVAIAAAMNSTLKVIRVRDGSLLDDDGLRLLAEFAEKHALQIWVERVSSDAATGIVIENGMVKQRDGKEAATA